MPTNIRTPQRGSIERREVLAAVELAAEKGKRFRFTDSSVDRYNSIIAFEGWKLDGFRKNPVMLFGHSYWGMPIGRWGDVVADEASRALYSSPAVWAETEEAQTVKSLVEADILRACSVGFDPIAWTYNEKRGGYDYLEQELLEVSIVTVPGNANALAEGRAAGIEVRSIVDHIERSIRLVRGVDPARAAELERLARLDAPVRLYSFARGDARVEAPTAEELKTLAAELLPATRDEGAEEPAGEPMKCASCGAEMAADAKYCSACGTKVEAAPADETEPAADGDEQDAGRAAPAALTDEHVAAALAALRGTAA